MSAPGWHTCDTGEVAGGHSWLSARERAVETELRFPKRRSDWRLGRWAAKQAVCANLLPEVSDVSSLARIEVVAAEDGAPEVYVDGEPAQVSLSVSHRAGRGLAVVVRSPAVAGCDLELVEPHRQAFLTDWFRDDERAEVGASPDPVLAVNLLWAVKEAVAKYLREGLRVDVRSIAARPRSDVQATAGWRPVEAAIGSDLMHGWWRRVEDFVAVVISDPAGPAPQLLRPAVATGSRVHMLPGS